MINIFKKLFGNKATFQGSDYSAPEDRKRLGKQAVKAFEYMKDNGWQTLNSISKATSQPEASVSAQLRNFRKPKFQPVDAIYDVEKRYAGKGLWEYKLIIVPNENMFKKVI